MGPLDYVTLTLTAGQVLGKNWENLEWGEQENKKTREWGVIIY